MKLSHERQIRLAAFQRGHRAGRAEAQAEINALTAERDQAVIALRMYRAQLIEADREIATKENPWSTPSHSPCSCCRWRWPP